MKIGFDILGGDFAPKNCLDGLVMASKELPSDVTLVLIGDSVMAKEYFIKNGISSDQFEYVHTTDVIEMGEHPTRAFSQKPNSTISLGYKLLKEKKIDAFASSGNTGAMLVGAMFTVKVIPGIIRPCITSVLPKENGGIALVLDVGTNADCKPDVLYQFGILGSICAKEVYKINTPKIGLLNIGGEPEKGNLVTQATHALMKESKDFNFVGNVEGREVFSDKADVIVCEGFVGNILLKTAEAFFDLIKSRNRSDDYFDKFNYEIYGGTPILGINANVLIGHGISSALAFKNMLLLCKDVVDAKLNDKIERIFQ
ncbi:phosphate acyltransferase PlsX [Aurantibacillus circumpalustris]|uniref:phosphate acyltransferase PlsX n=1 Tax=Aurantibacillus circumpalustris TaxID=3036359 RepID=UPI00295BF064|nr:phosphate acyltransferase PlsX [Aurantibacillus circumpalustris]